MMKKRSEKTVIGLTGAFGSGKSAVAQILEENGAYVINADTLAHEALTHKSPLFQRLYEKFKETYDKRKKVFDRKKLARIVFNSSVKRKMLETLVHPYVFERIGEEIGYASDQVIVAEVPLLYESGFDQFCNYVVVIKAQKTKINQRLLKKGFSKKEIQLRYQAQMPLDEKVQRAHFVIDNSGTLTKTRSQVQAIWETILQDLKGASKK